MKLWDCWAVSPKAGALPTALHPVMKFSNCRQTCGQRRFLTSYWRVGKCCQPKCPKAFRIFRGLRSEPEPHAPKAGALHPDMKLWGGPVTFSQTVSYLHKYGIGNSRYPNFLRCTGLVHVLVYARLDIYEHTPIKPRKISPGQARGYFSAIRALFLPQALYHRIALGGAAA